MDFQDYETKGRTIVSAFTITQPQIIIITFADKKYCRYDMAYLSGGTVVLVEIKFREYPSTRDAWYLQQSKYNDLQAIKKKFDSKTSPNEKKYAIHYINVFTDGVIQFWDITDLSNKETVSTFVGKTTCGDTTKVDKMQYELYNNETILKGKWKI